MNERKPIVVRIVLIALTLLLGLGICFAPTTSDRGALINAITAPTTVELDNVTPTEPVEEEVAPAPSTAPEVESTNPTTDPVETEPASTTAPTTPQYTAPKPVITPSEPTAPTEDDVVITEPEEETVPEEIPTEPVEEEIVITSAAAREALADPTFLAKLLYREAGSMGWEGQVYVCSAILNLCDYEGTTIWRAGHNANKFSVAPIVDSARPTQTQYDVIDYVINQGGRIPEVKYFRTSHYHNFGTPMCRIENVYFSK
jgi:hypothetical protein